MEEKNVKSSAGKIALICFGAVFGLFFACGLAVGVSYISAQNYGNSTEVSIQATYENNQVILSNYRLKIAEMAKVPRLQADDLTKIFTNTLGARYGTDGNKAAILWLQEQNPQLDTRLYVQLSQAIEAGRNEFTSNQTRLIDLKRSYKTALGSFWRGKFLKAHGYPQINLAQYRTIISKEASDSYESGVDTAVDIGN